MQYCLLTGGKLLYQIHVREVWENSIRLQHKRTDTLAF